VQSNQQDDFREDGVTGVAIRIFFLTLPSTLHVPHRSQEQKGRFKGPRVRVENVTGMVSVDPSFDLGKPLVLYAIFFRETHKQ
jgi:hypothetical protein